MWAERSVEERHLLNPSFCALLLWQAAQGYASERSALMPIELAFLVLPLVLHKETRGSLPSSIRTSLPTWLTEQPIVRVRLGERAATLRVFTKESLIFGGVHGLLAFAEEGIQAGAHFKKRVKGALQVTSDEVRDCAKRAQFLGRWFGKTGGTETVMMLLGVRP
jgi:hypothetical protein